MKIWINTGELSADLQSAEFLKEFKLIMPQAEVVGMGGEHLKNAGMALRYHIKDLSVMGISEVFRFLPKIISLLRKIRKSLEEEKPDLVLLVDCPDFNFFVARMAKKLNIPVAYFIPPKVWAWRTSRIKFLKQNIIKIYSILPFELEFYQKHGISVEYVGNPLVKLVNYPEISQITPIDGKIGLMPGSRKKEIENLLPEFMLCAEILKKKHKNLQFYLIKAPNITDDYIKQFWKSNIPLNIVSPENKYAFMRGCQFLLAASGTATLESALAGVPTMVCYKVNPASYWLGKKLIKVPYISLTNLIMQKSVFPEYIQDDAGGENLAYQADLWLENPSLLENIKSECFELRERCGQARSAKLMAEDVKELLLNL